MKRKSSYGRRSVIDAKELRTNQELAVSTNKMADQLKVSQERIDGLEAEKEALQTKLDEIRDIAECDDPECTAEEHLAEIQDVIENANGSNGKR